MTYTFSALSSLTLVRRSLDTVQPDPRARCTNKPVALPKASECIYLPSRKRPRYEDVATPREEPAVKYIRKFVIKIIPTPSWLDELEVGRKLGQGGFANVYKVSQGHEQAALKTWGELDDKGHITDGPMATGPAILAEEAAILKDLTHPNIIGCIKIYWQPSSRGKYCDGILLELGKADLEHTLSKSEKLSSKQVRTWSHNILSGLTYLRKQGYVHRDLRPANIIMCQGGTLKITDFGYSKVLESECLAPYEGTLNTLQYRAPEIKNPSRYGFTFKKYKYFYNHGVDVYAAGLVISEMLKRSEHDPLLENIAVIAKTERAPQRPTAESLLTQLETSDPIIYP